MITIEFHEGQGLGNQLWVYAAGRSIAEQLGMPFGVVSPERFKGKDFLEIDLGVEGNLACGASEQARIFHEELIYDDELDYVSSGFDADVLSIEGDVRLEGLFQSERYFFGDLDRLKRYIKIDDGCANIGEVDNEICILNIRGGEYKRHNNLILPKKYWTDAMKNVREIADVKKFLIVTDDPAYARLLLPGIDVLQGGVADCYAALVRAKYLVLSNSSFGYFPAKTNSNIKMVIAPQYWYRFGNRYGRWASPANLYQDWQWQDENGKLKSYDECIENKLETEYYYREKLYMRGKPHKVKPASFREFIPAPVRKKAKRVLSKLFPGKIG